MQNIINDILQFFSDSSNKFISDNNIFEKFTLFIEKFNKIFNTLSFEQQYALLHLSAIACILINLFAIISVLFGDQLVLYFKLEERFPKLNFILFLNYEIN
jgi:hypothetical protein